jgi:hypothetical protein
MKIRKLALFATACAAMFVVAPVASASAAKLKGTCAVEGKAEFAPENLKFEAQKGLEYKFTGKATCVDEVKGELRGTVAVSGKFGSKVNACLEGESEGPGIGKLNLSKNGKEPWEVEAEFELTFKAAAGNVALTIKPKGEPGEATGLANFAGSTEELAAQCAKAGGVKKLQFAAAAAGEL